MWGPTGPHVWVTSFLVAWKHWFVHLTSNDHLICRDHFARFGHRRGVREGKKRAVYVTQAGEEAFLGGCESPFFFDSNRENANQCSDKSFTCIGQVSMMVLSTGECLANGLHFRLHLLLFFEWHTFYRLPLWFSAKMLLRDHSKYLFMYLVSCISQGLI